MFDADGCSGASDVWLKGEKRNFAKPGHVSRFRVESLFTASFNCMAKVAGEIEVFIATVNYPRVHVPK